MRPLRKGVILVSLLEVLVSHSAAQKTVADVVKQSSDAVVLIVISNSASQETALGSGFLVSADGDIVTNYHVIKEAHSAVVKLSNGAVFSVDGVLASDANRDLAVIKVSGKKLPFLRLGSADNLHVGDHVVAIGSPLGLEGTVSDGIVSALRDVAKMKWIQTTAPVSHGNSGGPLLDMSNHVVGVISWGVKLEVGQNLNFAIPVNDVIPMLASIPSQVRALPDEAGGDVIASTSAPSADLQDTLDWMRINYEFIPPAQPSHYEVLTLDDSKACSIHVKKVETIVYAMKSAEYPITYVLDLGTLDPSNVAVSNSEIYPTYTIIKVRSSNGLYTIRGVGWPGVEARSKEYSFTFNDNHMAERFAKAFRHAITLCGGKASKF